MSITISILTHESMLQRGGSDFFPLIKWSKDLHNKGYKINFYNYHKKKNLLSCDILLLHHRYYEQIIKKNYSPRGFKANNLAFIKEILLKARQYGINIILFEGGDSSGTRQSEILPFVDLCLKKQIFKNKDRYTKKNGEHQVQIWLPDEVKELPKFKAIPPVSIEDKNKIEIGWNIGLLDYRNYHNLIKKYYPFNTYTIPISVYSKIDYTKPGGNKNLAFSYRGSAKGNNPRYFFNRKQMLETLNNTLSIEKYKYLLGGKVSFKKYNDELHNSKMGISPFGWGEICYRDFEIMIAGAILIKPDVSHLETYPDYFIGHETYIPTRWDHKDLPQIITDVEKNYSDYLHISKQAQEKFKYFNNSAQEFVMHFKSILNKL